MHGSPFRLMSALLDAIPDVDIDDSGKFKYVQIRVEHADQRKIIIRGYSFASYHDNIVQHTKAASLADLGAEGAQLRWKCIGGGRIQHDPVAKTLFVYGYSVSYGRCDHTVATKLLQARYPDYTITWSNDGY